MRDKDGIYFSPNYQFLNLKWNNPENLICAFEDRIKSFYFDPAEQLNKNNHAFASGIICLSLIDLFANLQNGNFGVRRRYVPWLENNIVDFNSPDPDKLSQTLAKRFYDEFRNCLIHECRIKNAGQFSYNYSGVIHLMRDYNRHIMIINPKLLLYSLKTSFEKYIYSIRENPAEYQKFEDILKSNFSVDFECAERGD